MHYLLSATNITTPTKSYSYDNNLEDFDFYSATGPMSSADELFLDGKIRPMKLPPVADDDEEAEDHFSDQNGGKIMRGRSEMQSRNRSLRRIRSMSPMRTKSEGKNEAREDDATARGGDAPSSRNSKKWVLLKEFLYRSKSEGRNNGRHKYFWSSLSFSPVVKEKVKKTAEKVEGERRRAVGKRRAGLSAHEVHYTENRAQAEEMRRKTFLPYRQGLLGCLGFNSKGVGAINGFARALNTVSSR